MSRLIKWTKAAALVFILLMAIQVFLSRASSGTQADPTSIDTPIAYLELSRELKVISQGSVKFSRSLGREIGTVLKIVGTDAKTDSVIVLCRTPDEQERYYMLSRDRTTKLSYIPQNHAELVSRGVIYSPTASARDITVRRHTLDGNQLERLRLRIPRTAVREVYSLDVSSQGDIAVSAVARDSGRPSVFLFDSHGHHKWHVGTGHSAAFSSSGDTLAYCGGGLGIVNVVDLKTKRSYQLKAWRPTSLLDYCHPFICGRRPYNTCDTQWSLDDKWILCSMLYSHSPGKVHAVKNDERRARWCSVAENVAPGDWSVVGRSWIVE